MFARFFIDRPIFAAVLSIVITLSGGVAVFTLPLAMYPSITPPTVQVDCRYPGASAQTVAESVAAPIEQQVNGVEGMFYMSSQCTNDGSYNLTVTFAPGINLNMAQVLVQNRVALAVPSLPDVIKATGVTVRKRSPDILLSVNINAPDGRFDQLYLSNYAMLHLREELQRLPGVSDVIITGQRDYAIRAWLDPDRLAARSLTAGDVVKAIRDQNVAVAVGQIGQPPSPHGQATQMTLSTLGRLKTREQFEDVVVKRTAEGRIVRLKDVARVELGARSFDVTSRLDRKESVGLPVFQLPDANALDVADAVKAKMRELSKDFPEGMIWEIQYDTTPYIRQSIEEVYSTLVEAIILVAAVVLLFLQNWRSAVIPLIAVPVAIVGTFAVMALVGFSLNNLTLFGLVLAIGIVVDDAIVVVEAVEHHIEEGMTPYAATVQAMREVSGPVVAVALVLCAVFVPCAFITGITGSFFKQFALTIAVSTVISAFNSLTLSPALAARLLKPRGVRTEPLPRLTFALVGAVAGLLLLRDYGWMRWPAATIAAAVTYYIGLWFNRVLAWSFRLFNHGFDVATRGYLAIMARLLKAAPLVLVVYSGLLGLTVWTVRQLPTGFIPSQDMGYLLVNVQLPDSASKQRTEQVMKKLESIALNTPGVGHVVSVAGQSLLLSAFGSNYGSQFVLLKNYDERRDPSMYGEAIAESIRKEYAKLVPEAAPQIFMPPPLRGIGRSGGFRIMVEDRGELGAGTLQDQADNLVEKGNELTEVGRRQPSLKSLFHVFRANTPQLYIDVNRTECLNRGVALRDVFDTLQIYLGSLYINDFNFQSRTWQVVAQADQGFRDQADDVKRLKVRNKHGDMVPIGTVASVREITGPHILTRFNMYPAVAVNGNTGPGVSSGQSIALMEQLAAQELKAGMFVEWTEMAFLEKQAGNTAAYAFGFSVVMVFLVLAAQYESWSLPLAVILVVPMCLLSSATGIWIANHDINVFTQIGFVVLVGLASKNAILIVEFAKHKRERGATARDAALDACKLRLRPIVMTSVAFILGVVPLLFSTGAGMEMRRALGTAVFSGMLGVTVFGVFLTPAFFLMVDKLNLREPRWRWLFKVFRSKVTPMSASSLTPPIAAVQPRELTHTPRH
ncbi:MAG: multidrug efflux RND transporter permease subunit [Gemmataceae bacterium]